VSKKSTAPKGKATGKKTKKNRKRRIKRTPLVIIVITLVSAFIGWRVVNSDDSTPAKADKGYTQPDEKDYSQKGGHSKEPNKPTTSVKTGVIDPCSIFDPDNLSEVYETAFSQPKASQSVTYTLQHEKSCVYSDGKGTTVTVHSSLNEAQGAKKTVVESLFAKGEAAGNSADETDPAGEGIKTWWVGENLVVLQLDGNVMWIEFSVSDQATAVQLVTTAGSAMRDQLVLTS
jgi:hypothetical protein